MRIALYIEDGLEQIVLTPETETEKGILGKLHSEDRELTVIRGSFYDCRGGWKRHGVYQHNFYSGRGENDESSIIMLRPKVQAPTRDLTLDLSYIPKGEIDVNCDGVLEPEKGQA